MVIYSIYHILVSPAAIMLCKTKTISIILNDICFTLHCTVPHNSILKVWTHSGQFVHRDRQPSILHQLSNISLSSGRKRLPVPRSTCCWHKCWPNFVCSVTSNSSQFVTVFTTNAIRKKRNGTTEVRKDPKSEFVSAQRDFTHTYTPTMSQVKAEC